MIYLNIGPIAVSIGHFMVRWYGNFIALGMAVRMWLTLSHRKSAKDAK